MNKDITSDLLHEVYLRLGDIPILKDAFPGLKDLPVVTDTIVLTWFIMAGLFIFSIAISRNINIIPGFWQSFIEVFIGFIKDICVSTMGKKWGTKFVSFSATMFLFIWLSNIITVIPITAIRNPTSDLSTPIGLGLLVFFVSHVLGIRTKGFKTYISDFYGPMIPLEKNGKNKMITNIVKLVILFCSAATYWYPPAPLNYVLTAFFLFSFWVTGEKDGQYWLPNLGLAPLNYIGEISKPLSHSCRLFGNIAGGGIIVAILCYFVPFVFPFFFNGYFGFVAGTIQAFIFTMLTIVYIGSQLGEE